MVRVILHKAASPLQATGSIVFARWRQCALMGGHIGVIWQIRLNVCFLLPTEVHNSNGKSIGSAVYAQMAAECPYTLQWDAPSPLKIAPFRVGIWTPSNTWFPGPTRVHNRNSISIGSAVFAGLTSVTDQQTSGQTTLLGR